jgi:hypothetical protein
MFTPMNAALRNLTFKTDSIKITRAHSEVFTGYWYFKNIYYFSNFKYGKAELTSSISKIFFLLKTKSGPSENITCRMAKVQAISDRSKHCDSIYRYVWLHTPFKGTVARDVFLPYHCIQDIGYGFKNCFDFCKTFASFSLFGECAKIFQLLLRTL